MEKKVVIPVMFRPYEDEMIESWIVRLARANGMPIHYFRNIFLGDSLDLRNRTQAAAPYYLDGLFWKAQSVMGFPDSDELLLFHTLIPLFQAEHEPVKFMARKAQAVLYDCGQEGYDVGYVHEPPARRMCPQCLNEDAERGILPHLKVWHQVPGVKVCAVHRCRLMTVRKDYDMSSISADAADEITDEDILSAEKVHSAYLRIRSMKDFRPVKGLKAGGLVPEASDKVFLYASCPSCGTRFLTTIYAVSKGRLCPVCDRKEDVIGRQVRMIPGCTPVRRIRSLADTSVIKHSCGQTLAWRAGDIIWNGRRCVCVKLVDNDVNTG